MNFNLLRDLVMVWPVPSKAQTDTGIIVTNIIDKTAPREGIVLTVGPNAGEYQFKDHVVYMRNNMHEVKHDKDVFHVIPKTEILCKLQPEAQT